MSDFFICIVRKTGKRMAVDKKLEKKLRMGHSFEDVQTKNILIKGLPFFV